MAAVKNDFKVTIPQQLARNADLARDEVELYNRLTEWVNRYEAFRYEYRGELFELGDELKAMIRYIGYWDMPVRYALAILVASRLCFQHTLKDFLVWITSYPAMAGGFTKEERDAFNYFINRVYECFLYTAKEYGNYKSFLDLCDYFLYEYGAISLPRVGGLVLRCGLIVNILCLAHERWRVYTNNSQSGAFKMLSKRLSLFSDMNSLGASREDMRCKG